MRQVARLMLILPLLLASCASLRSPHIEEVVDLRSGMERCPVHDERLLEDKQPISDGHQSFDGSYYRLRESLFPCDYTNIYMLGTHGTALVSYCPKCRFAKAKCNRDEDPPRPSTFSLVDREEYRREFDAFIERQKRELIAEYPAAKP